MIASTVRLQECDYSWKEWLVKNKAANPLLIFEETNGYQDFRIKSEMAERSFPLATTAPQKKRGGAHSDHWTDKADGLHRYHFDELISNYR